MVAALLTYEKITTTEVKAKEIRRLTERAITWARRLGDTLTKNPEKRSKEEKERVLHAIRMALRTVRDRSAVLKLFEEIAPRLLTRRGGYTRLIKVQPRAGDAAPMAILEIISSQNDEKKEKEESPKKAKGTPKEKKESPKGEPKTSKAKKEENKKSASAKKTKK
jgi:large subunit ribosomal protein L17